MAAPLQTTITLQSVFCILSSAFCLLSPVFCLLFSIFYMLFSALYILYMITPVMLAEIIAKVLGETTDSKPKKTAHHRTEFKKQGVNHEYFNRRSCIGS